MNSLDFTVVLLTSLVLWLTLINESQAVEIETFQANITFGILSVKGDYEHRREINVKSLPKNGMDHLMLTHVNLKWDEDEAEFLGNIISIRLDNVEVNPNSLTFSDSLERATLKNPTFINGTMVDLWRTATNLKVLQLHDMGRIDISNVAGIFGENLEKLFISDSEINANCLKFSDRLRHMYLSSVNVTNGTRYDLLRTATDIKSLAIDNRNSKDKIVDLSKLPNTESLTELDIWDSELISSSPIKLLELRRLSMDNVVLKTNIFQNFDEMFPKIDTVTPFRGTTVSPTDLLSILKSQRLTNLRVPFDFEPQIKTYEFGEIMKIISSAGFNTAVDRIDRVNFLIFQRDRGSGTKWTVYLLEPYGLSKSEKAVKPQDQQLFVYGYFLLLSLLMLLGIFGNALSFCVLGRKKFRNSSGFILLGLTFCDSLVILTYITSAIFNANIFYNVFFKIEIKQTGFEVEEYTWIKEQEDIQAFLIYPLNKTGYTGSVYTTVLISFERFVAVCWPLKSKRLLSPKKSKMAIFVIWIFSVVLNFPRWIESYEWSYYSESSKYWNDYYRPTLMRSEMYRSVYHGWIWVIVMYMLPFLLLGFFNYKILRQVKLSNQIRRSMQSARSELSNNEQSEDAEIYSLTKMLLCVVGVFALCNFIHIVIVFYFIIVYDNIQLSTIEAVSCLPLIINSSVNFIIYIVLGRTMRSEFLKMVPAWFLCFKSWKLAKAGEIELAVIPRTQT